MGLSGHIIGLISIHFTKAKVVEMTGKIVAVHSFRGGTGKSNLSANIATNVARQGKRVAIIDTDIQSPGIHVLFGMSEKSMPRSLNDYLWGKSPIVDVAYKVSEQANASRPYLQGLDLWLLPSSIRPEEITRILQEGYSVGLLNQGFHGIMQGLKLDYLFIDTHPGINEETLLSIAVSHILLLVLRPDQQDFQGTAVMVDIAQQLEVPHLRLVINKALSKYDPAQVKAEIESNYEVPVAAVLPLSEDVAANASAHLFSLLQPTHPWSVQIQQIVDELLRL
jgi:MinD-like ATPase involved in chromosome partitioning or flagellar assembly